MTKYDRSRVKIGHVRKVVTDAIGSIEFNDNELEAIHILKGLKKDVNRQIRTTIVKIKKKSAKKAKKTLKNYR